MGKLKFIFVDVRFLIIILTVLGCEPMSKQAKSFGCKIKNNLTITDLYLASTIKTIEVNNKDIYKAKSVILAPGGSSRTLGVEGETQFKGKGISYCATCDGDFFHQKKN